jgi:hypothetical protein
LEKALKPVKIRHVEFRTRDCSKVMAYRPHAR